MSIQITIIGLGQVGSSIGLALAGQKNIKRIGHDKHYDVARTAQKTGAVDEVKTNLHASVSGANIVLLCLPLSEIRETLEVIAEDLQDGTIIMDTAPAKATVATWIKELLPTGRHYISLAPAAGAGYLHEVDLGVASAHSDLFNKGLFLINAPQGTPEEAIKLATDLMNLLGAHVMLSDEVEVDGLLASTHILPQLAAAALLDATVDQPGWIETRKVAARPYALATAALAYNDEAHSLGETALANRENVVRVLDTYMRSLKELRDKIAAGDEVSVTTFIEDAFKARLRWFTDRYKADWNNNEADQPDIPPIGERLNQMFFGKILDRSKKKK